MLDGIGGGLLGARAYWCGRGGAMKGGRYASFL